MKVGLAYSTKDRTELTRQSVEPLLDERIALHWVDGSNTSEGEELPFKYKGVTQVHSNVRGGADSAIVYGLTALLNHPDNYDVVALAENDVLVHKDWLAPTLQLFERGRSEGLEVGAVSPRCFEDRVLLTRDGYSVCHNIGAGFILFTREAARLVLANFRTGYWADNRAIFSQLSGLDIGRWGAFRDREQHTTADWWFDAVLAKHGFASLALTPSPVQMIGQVPPLVEQGLKLVTEPVELLRDDKAFGLFAERTRQIRDGDWRPGGAADERLCFADGVTTIYPHQFGKLGAKWSGYWYLKWSQGFGPFSWKAGVDAHGKDEDLRWTIDQPELSIPIIGACELLVGGGEHGGQVEVTDTATGYSLKPQLLPDTDGQVMSLQVPPVMKLREIRLTALSEGIVVYGLRTRQPQPAYDGRDFDHSYLPPASGG